MDDEIAGSWLCATLNGVQIRIRESKHMVGAKKAVMADGMLILSPAMMDLVRHAEGDELKRLLQSIPYVDIGSTIPPEFGMTTPLSDD